jgi:hypothetical protein
LDSEVHLAIARLANGVEAVSNHDIGAEAMALISKLTAGDSAAAQVIHEALKKYLREREQPMNSLSPMARADAVAAVFRGLQVSRGAR